MNFEKGQVVWRAREEHGEVVVTCAQVVRDSSYLNGNLVVRENSGRERVWWETDVQLSRDAALGYMADEERKNAHAIRAAAERSAERHEAFAAKAEAMRREAGA